MTITTEAHERLVERIMREYFDALDTSDSTEEGGYGSQREMIEGDLKRLGPEEFYRSLKETDRVIYRLWPLVEEMNWVGMAVLSDAQQRTRSALRLLEEARGEREETR